jgi:chromosome partitioning protein
MPIITFANTKGGAGKTTVALLVAMELGKRGHKVALIDGDDQQWASRWVSMTAAPGFEVVDMVDESTIETVVKTWKKKADYILIDLPAGLNPLLAKAIGLSDRVLVPVQGCAMDAVGAAQVLDILKELETRCEIRIAHSVVMTRISSIITTRALVAVKALLATRKVHMLDTALVERAAYRDMFISGGTLYSLDPARVSNLDRAKDNVRLLADEVVALTPIKLAKPKAPRKPAAARKAA